MGTHPSITSEWLLSPTLSDPGNWPGVSIPRMEIAITSVLLDRMANTHIWHGRKKSSHHDRMAQPLYLTYSSEWLQISALISVMEGTNPFTMTEWLSPYIWPWKEPILSPCQNGYGSHHCLWEEASIWRTPSLSLKYSNFILANGFVNTSAICSSVAGASLLLSAPYPWYSDIWSRYASTCHGTLDSLTTSRNSGCHNVYK